MNKFTDDDLKRLKDKEGYWRYNYRAQKENPQMSEAWGWVDGTKIDALLARLEAAEKVVERFECLNSYDDNAYAAWRKSKGESA